MSADELADGVFAARERFYSWSSIGRRVLSREAAVFAVPQSA